MIDRLDDSSPASDTDRSRPHDRLQPWLLRKGLRLRRLAPLASGVVAALVAVWMLGIVVPGPAPLTQSQVRDTIRDALAAMTPGPARSQLVYQVAAPSVVEVRTKGGEAGAEGELGSGVVVDDGGDILTSLHVIEDAGTIQVTFADGSRSPALIVNRDPEQDIAVLQALQRPQQLIPAILGDPNGVHVGDEAYAIGSPFGLSSSMSSGVVSGLGRSLRLPNSDRSLSGLIQFDAAVNPGNSGGPLLNRDGYVIGIVAALLNPTDQRFFVGIGLAVPITAAGGAFDLPPF
jgi:S1-C subfamily serine protease